MTRIAGPAPRARAFSHNAGGRFARREAAEPWRRWYRTARWRALRLVVAAEARFVRADGVEVVGWVCERTGVLLTDGRKRLQGGLEPLVVHHVRPHRGDERLFWDRANLQAVSKAWHDRDAQAEERGGWVNPWRAARREPAAQQRGELFSGG